MAPFHLAACKKHQNITKEAFFCLAFEFKAWIISLVKLNLYVVDQSPDGAIEPR